MVREGGRYSRALFVETKNESKTQEIVAYFFYDEDGVNGSNRAIVDNDAEDVWVRGKGVKVNPIRNPAITLSLKASDCLDREVFKFANLTYEHNSASVSLYARDFEPKFKEAFEVEAGLREHTITTDTGEVDNSSCSFM